MQLCKRCRWKRIDSDTADATLQANIDALQTDVDGNEAAAITELNDLGDVLKESNSLYIGKDPSATTNNAQQNVSVGTTALGAITTGDKNTAVGFNALAKTAAGINNVSVGFSSLSKVTSGSYNVAVGNGAGSNVIGGSSSVLLETMLTQVQIKEHQVIELLLEPLLMLLKTIQL